MRIVIAPDSYKESIGAYQASKCIEEGLKRVMPEAECIIAPMADGGEGTAECLTLHQKAKRISCQVTGPLGESIDTDFVWLEETKTAVIEVAKACGIMLIPPSAKDPLSVTSYGVGELMKQALSMECKELILTLGGTVSNDGGSGMLLALGAELLDSAGRKIPFGARGMEVIAHAELSEPIRLLKEVKVTVLCDVKNPLLGEEGATHVFGPQKGVTGALLPRIEQAMKHYAEKITEAVGKDLTKWSGAGAAGGLGFALFAVSDARFCSGADYVMERMGFEEKVKDCDFVITGEGSIDPQSLQGKVPVRVASVAKKYHKPVYVFVGKQSGSMEPFYENGITAVFSILRNVKPIEQVLEDGEKNLTTAVENFARVIKEAGHI